MITQCDSRVESTRSAATKPHRSRVPRGQGIAALRSLPASSDAQPEQWLGSTTGRQDDQVSGLPRLLDGSTLQQLVAADHEAWVGRYAAQLQARPTQGFCSNCSTPDSGSRFTSIPTALSLDGTSTAPTGRPRRGSSWRRVKIAPSTWVGRKKYHWRSSLTGATLRTETGCWLASTGSRCDPASRVSTRPGSRRGGRSSHAPPTPASPSRTSSARCSSPRSAPCAAG